MMEYDYLEKVIAEELREAELRIFSRIVDGNKELFLEENSTYIVENKTKNPLPDNQNYAIALNLYLSGETHSAIARKLSVSINAVKKYYNWLVKHGYLPIDKAELSDAELKVVDCVYNRSMSLRETANELNCSMTNVVYRRDSALRKGYNPVNLD